MWEGRKFVFLREWETCINWAETDTNGRKSSNGWRREENGPMEKKVPNDQWRHMVQVEGLRLGSCDVGGGGVVVWCGLVLVVLVCGSWSSGSSWSSVVVLVWFGRYVLCLCLQFLNLV